MKLIFKVGPAKDNGRSEIVLVLGKSSLIAKDSDQILSTLDKLLKKNRINIKEVKDIKLVVSKQAGLTSQRIVKSIIKALSLD